MSASASRSVPAGSPFDPGSRTASTALVVLIIALFSVPTISRQRRRAAHSLFIFMILAIMWNPARRYGGLVSVGQQAFIGMGAYANHLPSPSRSRTVRGDSARSLVAAALAASCRSLSSGSAGGQFAVGTWS